VKKNKNYILTNYYSSLAQGATSIAKAQYG